jgi:outer membrane receptor protein involved in Fe transport
MARSTDRAAVLAALVLTAASPAKAADRQQISIAGGRLGDAAIALGRQTGSSIGMSDQALAGIRVKGVRGRMTLNHALTRLLNGSDARAVRVAEGSWRIVRAEKAASPDQPLTPTITAAQDPESVDIVVTASKRDIPLPRYAGVVEQVSGDILTSQEASAGTATLLTRIASLSSTHVGAGRNKLFIRAIADSGFSGPTQATTGQYLSDMRLNYAAPDPDLRLYDVGGIEVLEGPQGTLYGAGSLGGIVRIIPNPPNLAVMGGQVSSGLSAVQHGNVGGDVSATLNLPIVPEKLALRVVGYGVNDAGYIDNVLTGKNDINRTYVYGGRAALRFAPNEDWTIDLSGVYQHIEGRDAQYASRSAGNLSRASSVTQPYDADYLLGNIRIEKQWDDLRFVSSTGYVRHELSESYDATQADGIPALFRQRNRVSIFSTENRLVRDLDNGLGWILGASYLQSTSDINRSLTYLGSTPAVAAATPIIPGVPILGYGRDAPTTGVHNQVHEATLFGEASFEPLPGLIATLGGRFTLNRLEGQAIDPIAALSATDLARAEAQANRSEKMFLPSFSLLTDRLAGVTLYARFQQGFRPGGLAIDDQRIERFHNDRMSTVEVGMRKGVAGRDPFAIALNAAYTDWRDIQADLTDRLGLPTTANIGDGRIYTLEGRVAVRPTSALTLDGSIIYNDSRLTAPAIAMRLLNYQGKALSLPNVANLGGRFSADYRLPVGNAGQLRLSASARYVGKSRLGVGPIFGQEQGDYVDTALTASLRQGAINYSLSLTNILDTVGNRFALGTPFNMTGEYFTPLRPRTLRMGVDFAF